MTTLAQRLGQGVGMLVLLAGGLALLVGVGGVVGLWLGVVWRMVRWVAGGC